MKPGRGECLRSAITMLRMAGFIMLEAKFGDAGELLQQASATTLAGKIKLWPTRPDKPAISQMTVWLRPDARQREKLHVLHTSHGPVAIEPYGSATEDLQAVEAILLQALGRE